MSDTYVPDWAQDESVPLSNVVTAPSGRPRITIGPKPLPINSGSPGGSSYAPDWAKDESVPIGAGEAGIASAANSAAFGLIPAIVGLQRAGATNPAAPPMPAGVPSEAPGLENIGAGLAAITTPEGRAGYEAGRADALKYLQSAQEQHPIASAVGTVGGALLTPGFGAGAGGTLGARLAAGAVGGAIGGGAYGAGSELSAGGTAEEIAGSTARGAVMGGVMGGPLNAALGPRAAAALGTGPGAKAAQTAERLGAPLPRGVASENAAIRGTTAATTSIPIVGTRIQNAVNATREAAGNAIGQSGIDEAIAANRKTIDNLYNGVRNRIDPDKVMPMPQTAAAVAAVRARRVAARQSNPDLGLEQFKNIGTQGASFNGSHRARVDAREAGDVLSPHPGYNAADYNQITRAMTKDIRLNVARQGGSQALNAFEKAEKNFGRISDANKFLSRIARQRGPGAGLDELGFNPATGEFSLDKFVTAWNKINPQARPFVPEAAQRRNIEDIFEMGQHIKGSMRGRNTSHTSNVLILWDLARDAIMTGAAVGAGVVSGASVLASGAAVAPAIVFMHWLSNPAASSSMANWSRAYTAWRASGSVIREAQLRIATRNLANTLGLPAQRVFERLTSGGATDQEQQEQQQQPGQ